MPHGDQRNDPSSEPDRLISRAHSRTFLSKASFDPAFSSTRDASARFLSSGIWASTRALASSSVSPSLCFILSSCASCAVHGESG